MLIYFICALSYFILNADALSVRLKHNGPVVLGATVQVTATVQAFALDNFRKGFKYNWLDDAIPNHRDEFESDSPISTWNVTYDRKLYTPSNFTVQVTVCDIFMEIDYRCISARIPVEVTGDLNAAVLLSQNSTILKTDYVSNSQEVEHQILLKESDFAFLEENDFNTSTFWFLNCTYFGVSNDLKFRFNYTKEADNSLWLRALLVAYNKTDDSVELQNVTWPGGSCNNSYIPQDPDRLYGYFQHRIMPRRPIVITKVNGTNWLKNGDLLNLTITCTGSPPYYHCIKFIEGEYNATGNETCKHNVETPTCKVDAIHYYARGEKHTVLFIIKNEVSHTVTGVGITKYEAKKHAPLSVIIVPISCCAVAVVLIVFGVAYYIQSKNRYTIEVADFDFSSSQDTEYKSFRERLREAVSTAFTRVPLEEGEESPSWSPSRKYGSMQ